MSFIALDIGTALSNENNLSAGYIVGFLIRYIILFAVGGFVAYLHDDEDKPFKVVELGIAAPALITSLMTAQAVYVPPIGPGEALQINSAFSFSVIGSAYAGAVDSKSGDEKRLLLAGFFNDINRGITGSMAKENRGKNTAIINKPVEPAEVTPVKASSVDDAVAPDQKDKAHCGGCC